MKSKDLTEQEYKEWRAIIQLYIDDKATLEQTNKRLIAFINAHTDSQFTNELSEPLTFEEFNKKIYKRFVLSIPNITNI